MADDENSRLHRQKTYDAVQQNNRIVADIGLFYLKMVLVLNGAASIALISMHEIIAKPEGIGSELIQAGYFFLSGLGTAGVAVGFFYLFQMRATGIIADQLKKYPRSPSWLTRFFDIPSCIITILCVASFGLFIWGGVSILTALKQLAGNG